MVQKKNSKSSLQSPSVGGEPSALCPQSDFTFLSFADLPPSNFPAQPQALLTLSWLPVTLASHLKAAAQLSIYSRGEERRTVQGEGREGEWQLFKGSNFKPWVTDLSTLKDIYTPTALSPSPFVSERGWIRGWAVDGWGELRSRLREDWLSCHLAGEAVTQQSKASLFLGTSECVNTGKEGLVPLAQASARLKVRAFIHIFPQLQFTWIYR